MGVDIKQKGIVNRCERLNKAEEIDMNATSLNNIEMKRDQENDIETNRSHPGQLKAKDKSDDGRVEKVSSERLISDIHDCSLVYMFYLKQSEHFVSNQ